MQSKATAPAGLKALGRMPGSQQLQLAISLPCAIMTNSLRYCNNSKMQRAPQLSSLPDGDRVH